VRKFYNIKYLEKEDIYYKYAVYEKNKLITEFLSSEEINLKDKAIRKETISELSEIIAKHKINGI
jgi:hypothetical protein